MAFVGCGWITPSDFWRMHPDEIWWLYKAKTEKTKSESLELTESEYDDLYNLMTSI